MHTNKIYRVQLSLITLGIFAQSVLHAQDTVRLSLEGAIRQGLENNKSIQADGLNLDIDAARAKQFNSVFYPSVNGNAGIAHYINVPVQYAQADILFPTAPSDEYVGLKLLLPNSFTAGVTANWVLYNQAVFSALKMINEQTAITEIQLQKNKSDLAYNISQLYYGIAFARKQKDALVKISGNIDRLLSLLQVNYANGTVMKTELDKVRVNKANITSQINDLSSAIETQAAILKLLTGVPSNSVLKLTDTDFEQTLQPIMDTASGSENTFEYKLIQTQIKLNYLERKSIIASSLPTLGLAYNYNYNIVSPDFDKVLSSKFNFPIQYIGLNLSVPIFNGNNNLFKLKENNIRSRQLDLQQQFLAQKLSTDIVTARLRYNASLSNMVSDRSNVKLAMELYDQSLEQYRQGTILLTDVLTYETSLEQASTQYFNSESAALLSLLEYRKSTNTILTK